MRGEQLLDSLVDAGGVWQEADGTLRFYHATDQPAATAIVEELALRPTLDLDPAQAMLRGQSGSVYLSSLPTIGNDLGTDDALLAVRVAPDIDAEIIREAYGEPPRLELEVRVPIGETLPLLSAELVARSVEPDALPAGVRDAIALFEDSDVGRQLRRVDEQDGRCKRASLRFIAALRECGQDGSILEWAGGGRKPGEAGWFHDVVLLDGSEIVVDWTGAQFEEDEQAKRLVPYPRVEARATAEERWGRPREYSPESNFFSELPDRLPPWSSAQQRIPERDSSQERLYRF